VKDRPQNAERGERLMPRRRRRPPSSTTEAILEHLCLPSGRFPLHPRRALLIPSPSPSLAEATRPTWSAARDPGCSSVDLAKAVRLDETTVALVSGTLIDVASASRYRQPARISSAIPIARPKCRLRATNLLMNSHGG